MGARTGKSDRNHKRSYGSPQVPRTAGPYQIGMPSLSRNEGFAAAGDFASKDGFHTFELHLGSNHCDFVAVVKGKVAGLYELRGCKVNLNCFIASQPQDQVRSHTTAHRTLSISHFFYRPLERGFGRPIVLWDCGAWFTRR